MSVDRKQSERADAREQPEHQQHRKEQFAECAGDRRSGGRQQRHLVFAAEQFERDSQVVSLSQPDLRNCQLTHRRVPSSSNERR